MTAPRSDGFVRMPDAEFEAILTRAAEEGAKRALADVGLDGDEVVAAVHAVSPAVILLDLRMPRLGGVEATRLVRALPSPPHVIALTTWDVDDAVVRSLEAGADGFLLKTAAPLEIVGAIRAVMQGDAVLSPRSTRQLLDHVGRRAPAQREGTE